MALDRNPTQTDNSEAEDASADDVLIEEVSIDGMCGVY